MFYRLTGGEEQEEYKILNLLLSIQMVSSDTNVPPSSGDEVNDIDFKDYKFSADNLPEFTSFGLRLYSENKLCLSC